MRRAAAIAVIVAIAGCASGCAPGGGESSMDRDAALAELVAAAGVVALGESWRRPVPPSPLSCGLVRRGDLEWVDAWEGSAAPGDLERVIAELGSRGFAWRIRRSIPELTEVLADAESGLRIAYGARTDGTAFVQLWSACFREGVQYPSLE